ncbi:MAG: dolichyl-phosphate-mannose--protein mannosyltransferase [Deltaproteobacteria bacterium HGW-Deltaproteobacteria-18]|jgi:4-amino-4-deoxy-L-arabinose transferase-like glycosyltransferase|nr:MAG: dolichyl-phosphate-mannose--protein mannosyltransferase [Deltaproteobacteria bacterium HGW-Deltaproteobacteria-18]
MTNRQESALYWALSLLLIAAATLARYWFVASGQLNLAPDEAQYWDWSRSLQWSYYSKGPLIAFINYVGTAFRGATELGVRSGAMIGALVMQVAVLGWIGIHLKRIRTAFWTLFVLNTTMLFMAGGLLMTTDNPLLVFWLLGMICFGLAVDKGHLAAFIMLGLCLSLGITAKYTMVLFIPLALVAAFWIGRKQDMPALFWPRLLKTLGIGGLVGMLPILIWNATNGWVGIKHVLYRGAMAGDKAKVFFELKNFPEYLGSQLGVVTPWWFVFLFIGAWLVAVQLMKSDKEPVFPWLSRPMGIILTVYFWPVWLFFLFWSLHTKVEANWSATAYPAGIMLAALAVERFVHRDPRPRWRFAWPALGAVVFILLHLQGFIPFDSPKNPVHRLMGWQDLGVQVAQARDELGPEENVFVFGDEYGVTAELSFYVPGQKRAFCLAGGRKMNQYDLWPGPDSGMQNAVFVCKGQEDKVSDRVLELFESVDEPRVITSTHGKRTGQTFTIFLCRGYKGVWPEQEGRTF